MALGVELGSILTDMTGKTDIEIAEMDVKDKNSSGRHWADFAGSAIVSVVFFLYMWRYIDPNLIYHSFGRHITFPVYQTGWGFLSESLAYPGGAVDYLSRLVSQLYFFGWAGAAIIAAVAWGICGLTRTILARGGGVGSSVLCYFPVVVIAEMYSRYEHPLATCLAVLAGLAFVAGHQRLDGLSVTVRTVLFVVAFVLLYYLAAGGALLFAAMVAVGELVLRRRVVPAVIAVLVAAFVGLLASRIFLGLDQADALGRFLSVDPGIAVRSRAYVLVLYLFFPLAVLAGQGLRIIVQNGVKTAKRRDAQSQASAGRGPLWRRGMVKWTARMVLVLGIGGGAVFLSINSSRRTMLRITSLGTRGQWGEIIRMAVKSPSILSNVYVNHDVDLALFYAGQLGSNMFSFPQEPEALLLGDPVGGGHALRHLKMNDMRLALGYVNQAQKQANDIIEDLGECPFIIEQLAMIHIVKRQTDAARVLLNRLCRDLIYRRAAQALLARLDDDRGLDTDAAVRRLRACMSSEDRVVTGGTPEEVLTESLRRNKGNRMAFEYLMAYYLLTGQHDKVADNMYRLDDFGYGAIPRHYEEAILLHTAAPGTNVELGSRRISEASRQRFVQFDAMRSGFRGDRQAAVLELGPQFGNTYFFYFVFESTAASRFWRGSGASQ